MKTTRPLPLQQHPNFAAALHRLGQPVKLQDLNRNTSVLVLKRFGVSFASRGPVWQDTMSTDEKAAQLRQSGLRIVNADKDAPTAYRSAGFRLINTPASVAELKLDGTSADILARAHGKWRNIWRRGQNGQLTFTQERFARHRHGWILQADRTQQREKGYRALPHAVIEAYAANRPKDVKVHIAHKGSDPVAAMIFLLHHPVATYHLGWANADARRLGAHHWMIMDAASRLGARGFTRVDLGHVDTETAPGLARFKIGTGAHVRPLGGTWLKLPGL